MNQLVNYLYVFILSAIPILEQKASIPLGMRLGLNNANLYVVTLIGAVLPAPFILLFMPKIFEICKKIKLIAPIFEWYENRAMKKGSNIVKYELLGLFIFVAIPLPGTGVWTGSTVAAFLKLDFKKAFVTVILGAAVCGIIWLVGIESILRLLKIA